MDLRNVALNLINKHGKTFTATRVINTAYDVENGDITGTTKTYSGIAVSVSLAKGDGKEAYIKNELSLTIAPNGYIPEEGDKLNWNGNVFIVSSVETISPNGIDQVYGVTCTR